MTARTRYTVPEFKDAKGLSAMASEAIEAAREGDPNQRELADRLFRAIFGARHLTVDYYSGAIEAGLRAIQPDPEGG